MIQFPETAQREWEIAASTVVAAGNFRKRVARDAQVANEVERLHVRHEAKEQFQQELDAAETVPLVIETVAEAMKASPAALVDLIDGAVRDEGVTLVIGPAGAGKTTLAVQMANSLLTGDDWLYQSATKIKGSVGLMSYDQSAAIPRNWMSKMGLDLTRVSVLDINGRGNPLAVPSEKAKLVQGWKAMGVEVVIIDSFSASFSGDQNDAGLVAAWYKQMKGFVFGELGARALIILAHSTPANPEKPRGSTVHTDMADSIIAVRKHSTGDRLLSVEKYRAGLGQEQMNMLLLASPDDVTHLVDVDITAMQLEGLDLPSALAFPTPTTPHEAPDTESEDEDL